MRVHADPTPVVTDALRDFFTTDPDPVAAFGGIVRVVAEKVPVKGVDAVPWVLGTDMPLITVHDDGGPAQWPIMRTPTVRVTARARGLPLAKQVAAWAQGYLHDNLPAGLAYISPNGNGLVTAVDSETGADMASFTVTATVATVETV